VLLEIVRLRGRNLEGIRWGWRSGCGVRRGRGFIFSKEGKGKIADFLKKVLER